MSNEICRLSANFLSDVALAFKFAILNPDIKSIPYPLNAADNTVLVRRFDESNMLSKAMGEGSEVRKGLVAR